MGQYASKLNELLSANVSKPGLIRVKELLKRLGNPQNELKCVHVAGTNGKGSTCAYIESALRCAGSKTGLFTSPHIKDIREYIKTDNETISEEKFEKHAQTALELCEKMVEDGFDHPTFFEVMTAIAFDCFSDEEADVVIIETGMGGKGDATNVIYPVVSVITPISLDHVEFLGSTITQIAQEKAGIIKPDIPVVISKGQPKAAFKAINSAAKKLGCDVYEADIYDVDIYDMTSEHTSFTAKYGTELYRFKIKNTGEHQAYNAVTALCAVHALADSGFDISYSAAKQGICSAKVPGRIEFVEGKKIVIDASHNSDGVAKLAETLSAVIPDEKKVLVCSMLKTRDAEGMAHEYAGFIDYAVITKSDHPAAASPEELCAVFEAHGIECEAQEDIQKAVEAAAKKSSETDAYTVVSGSFYMIDKAKELLKEYIKN